ncbi:MAG: chitobiase/beta-hexosaminidase C-terminal domain-containing protein [Candidatus Omnitrophica bacterium]|nr:chitobiase/beta-hexosaminidase C-terminal domain-containing protein [Candidatus Omnitrophota bacterium]
MHKLFYIACGTLLICTLLCAENSGVRDLPDSYIPGGTFVVTVNITIDQQTPVNSFIITEYLPQGWSIKNADPYWSKYKPEENSYKWLCFSQCPVYGNFSITYTVKVPSDASGSYNFSGTINDGYSTRDITGDTTINQHLQVSSPVFSPQPQILYNFFPDVEISCPTAGATIYYTVDGSDPDQSSSVYSAPIHLTQTTTIKARAYKDDYSPSQIATGTFTIQIQKADINRDTSVDISDVILCLRMAIGLDITVDSVQYSFPYNDWLIAISDINNDGVIDISDVILALRISIGLS